MNPIHTRWSFEVERYAISARAGGRSERTLEGRKSALRAFELWCRQHGARTPSAVTPAMVAGYAADLVTLSPSGRRYATGTRRNRLTALRVFFRWWARQALERLDPCLGLELPRVPRTLPQRGFDRSALRRLRRACMAHHNTAARDRALVEFLLASGLRRSECCQLDVEDLDSANRWVRVRAGKGGHERVVPISRIALRWLRAYLRSRRPLHPADPVFVSVTGRRYSPGRLTDLVRRLLQRAGVAGRGACHRFRHTLATTMLENGADIRHIQAMLGHADISTTMIYASVVPMSLRAVYDRTHPGVKRTRRPKHQST